MALRKRAWHGAMLKLARENTRTLIRLLQSSSSFINKYIDDKQDLSHRIIIFLFLNQNICCGYSKELSHWHSSFEHPKHILSKSVHLVM